MILGAGGAIGSALLERYLKQNPKHQILATHRLPVSSTSDNIRWVECDYEQPGFTTSLLYAAQDLPHIDRFICATGMLQDDSVNAQGPEKRLSQVSTDALCASYRINAAAPLETFAAFEHLLKAAQAPKAMFLSALVGSIEDNQLGGWYAYRMAKSALNMGVRCAAIEANRWRNDATVIAAHPGTTHSGLSHAFVRNRPDVQSPETCASQLCKLIESLQPSHNGEFFNQKAVRQKW